MGAVWPNWTKRPFKRPAEDKKDLTNIASEPQETVMVNEVAGVVSESFRERVERLTSSYRRPRELAHTSFGNNNGDRSWSRGGAIPATARTNDAVSQRQSLCGLASTERWAVRGPG